MSRFKPRPGTMPAQRAAFTLVELLVVIGIIAVLVGILLPSLSAARRSAQQVKCGAALQEIGLGFQLYSNEQKGYYPVAKCSLPSYQIGDVIYNYNGVGPAYWTNFIADYVAANKVGNSAQSGNDAQQAHRTILWGCPAWESYVGQYPNEVQTGYGMNGFPTFSDSHPALGVDEPDDGNPAHVESSIVGTSLNSWARFYKQGEWTHAGSRALVGDSLYWFMESLAPLPQASYPPGIVPQYAGPGNAATWTPGVQGQTQVDIYRHGKKPGTSGSGSSQTWNPTGGKVGYNMLFCDGHVGQFSEAQTAYMATRQRFPL